MPLHAKLTLYNYLIIPLLVYGDKALVWGDKNKLVEWKAFIDTAWGLRVPIWKINFCSRVLRLSVLPLCRERPQTTICCLEWFEELNQFITAVNSFHPAHRYSWEISDTSSAFLDIKLLKATVYAPMCTTNPQILIVICCIHLHIHHMSRILFLILSFLDFVAFVVRTLIFP